jgi:hypothetical protein
VAHVYGVAGGERDFGVGGIKMKGEAYWGRLNGVREGPWDAVFVDGLD